ncbi:transmembrane protein 6/97 [Xylariaceae sp. FL1272]|nr:transmembrane protein 6/97 [Xylariaceae sp. FL1272]
MASSTRSVLDTVYLAYFLIHIPILFCVDLVPLYPQTLWLPKEAPLHFLAQLREYYIENYNDQFFLPPPAEIPSFFPLYAFLELVFHLPVSLWAVRTLWSRGPKGLSGSAEILFLVYGVETALTTATCMYDAALWDPAVVTVSQKITIVAGLYGSYFALAMLLTVDMYARLLKRVNAADAAKKTQ